MVYFLNSIYILVKIERVLRFWDIKELEIFMRRIFGYLSIFEFFFVKVDVI